ncbi:MAG: ATP-binding protein [Elusimicrobia bacterium]|nr:ATP-binding protein [Elusimicrobiota bacterium]
MKTAFARTSNVNAFAAAMTRLQNRQAGVPGMALVSGAPGLGKTRTAIWYAAQDSKVIYLRAKALMTPRGLLEELASELKAAPSRRAFELFINCRQKLKEIPGVMILVDEVDYLFHDVRMIDTLRDLHDDSGAAVVMLGMDAIDRKLSQHQHLYDRFAEVVKFRELSATDVKTVFDQLCDVRLSDDAVRLVHQDAKRFRQIVRWLYKAEAVARANSLKEITADKLGGMK